jgi:hypothetical protein
MSKPTSQSRKGLIKIKGGNHIHAWRKYNANEVLIFLHTLEQGFLSNQEMRLTNIKETW